MEELQSPNPTGRGKPLEDSTHQILAWFTEENILFVAPTGRDVRWSLTALAGPR